MAKTIKGIQTANEFSLRKKAYLDDREEFDTLADMASFDDVPDGFITLNKENGKRYEYNSSNTIDTNLGKWREYKSGGSGTTNYNDLLNKPSINGVELSGNKTLNDLGITNYDDTQVNNDIADLDTNKQDKTDNALDTTDKTVVGAINEINDSLLDNVTFSADYKNIIINRKSGLNPYTIPIASIINNAKITELNDIDTTNIGDGKTLIYDGTTKKHKYVDSTGTDELVKMDSTTDAKHLSELIDKSTVINDNGVLKVKKLDGQEVTIAEINYLKGLTMNVMDLVNVFANGGVKVLNTPVNTHADLSTLDRSTFLDGISYIVYVLADETHSGAKTTYLCDKTSETFFGNADSQRNFITNPIDLANEVTGKLDASNIDVDELWKLLTINDTYKTLTTKDEVFGTHGAKALYDELVSEIGKKANATDLASHTSDTNIHITTAERDKWNSYNTTINEMKTNFQDGVNTIYDSVVARGVTPTDKSPSSIVEALDKTFNNSILIKEYSSDGLKIYDNRGIIKEGGYYKDEKYKICYVNVTYLPKIDLDTDGNGCLFLIYGLPMPLIQNDWHNPTFLSIENIDNPNRQCKAGYGIDEDGINGCIFMTPFNKNERVRIYGAYQYSES